MKKTVSLVLILAVMLGLLAGCGGGSAQQSSSGPSEAAGGESGGLSALSPITILFAIPNGTNNIETIYAEKWMDLVKERSEGKISFDYSNGGALGSYAELLEGVENSVYDMTITEPSYIQNYVPESVLLSLPMEFSSYDEATAVFDGEVGRWYKDLVSEQTNIQILNDFYCGFRYICSEKEIKTLDDCKGVLIRSPEIDVYTDLLGLMGFSYVTMSFSEAYTAMQTGVIEAVEVPLQNIYEAGFCDLGKYITGTRHLLSVNCVVANENFWNGLPAEYREIMETALREVTLEEREQCAANEADYITKLEEAGCTVNEFDDASVAKLSEIFQAYWLEQIEPLGGEAVAQLNKIIEQTA